MHPLVRELLFTDVGLLSLLTIAFLNVMALFIGVMVYREMQHKGS